MCPTAAVISVKWPTAVGVVGGQDSGRCRPGAEGGGRALHRVAPVVTTESRKPAGMADSFPQCGSETASSWPGDSAGHGRADITSQPNSRSSSRRGPCPTPWPHLTVALRTASRPSPQLPPGVQPPGHGSRLLSIVKVTQTRCKHLEERRTSSLTAGLAFWGACSGSFSPARLSTLLLWDRSLASFLSSGQSGQLLFQMALGVGLQGVAVGTGLGSQVVQDVRG